MGHVLLHAATEKINRPRPSYCSLVGGRQSDRQTMRRRRRRRRRDVVQVVIFMIISFSAAAAEATLMDGYGRVAAAFSPTFWRVFDRLVRVSSSTATVRARRWSFSPTQSIIESGRHQCSTPFFFFFFSRDLLLLELLITAKYETGSHSHTQQQQQQQGKIAREFRTHAPF